VKDGRGLRLGLGDCAAAALAKYDAGLKDDRLAILGLL
jgi:hypothetical protein